MKDLFAIVPSNHLKFHHVQNSYIKVYLILGYLCELQYLVKKSYLSIGLKSFNQTTIILNKIYIFSVRQDISNNHI